MSNKFIFYYPIGEIGGIHTLIRRLVLEANRIGNDECIVIDNADGTVFNLLNHSNAKYIAINNSEYCWEEINNKYNIEDYTLIFMAGSDFSDLIYTIKEQAPKLKILFYLVHPETLLNFYLGTMVNKLSFNNYDIKKKIINNMYKKLTEELKIMLIDLNNNNSMIFMDGENLEYSEQLLNVKFDNKKIIPIPITNINKNEWSNGEKKPFVWLGRLEKSKSNVLKAILKDYSNYVEKRNDANKFIIIGDGDAKNELEELVNKLGLINYVEFKGIILGDELKLQLLDGSILFAMGTSALEGACIGVPTILVDWYKYIPKEVNYRWLYNTENYTLGKIINRGMNNPTTINFEEVILQYNCKPIELSDRCYQYIRNHEVKNVYKVLCQEVERISCLCEDINCEKVRKIYNDITTVKLWRKINKR